MGGVVGIKVFFFFLLFSPVPFSLNKMTFSFISPGEEVISFLVLGVCPGNLGALV